MDFIVHQLAAELLSLLPEQHAASALERLKLVPRACDGRWLPAVMSAEDRERRMQEFDHAAASILDIIDKSAMTLRQAKAEWQKDWQ
jgi:hypothetical protein